MALTSVVLYENATKPKDQGYLAITTGDNEGVVLTLDATAPNTGVNIQVAEITSDTAYFWSYRSGQTAAAGTMVPVLAYEKLRVEVPGGSGLSLYMRSSIGTAKMSVVQI